MPTVLIADDDADHRELLTLSLQRAGYDLVVVADADEALAAVRAGGLDAALLDVRMPGGTGIDLCRRLRAEPGTDLLPIMLVSADVGERQILAALQAGADDYLTKPFRRAELYARVDHLLRYGPSIARRAARAATATALAARLTAHRSAALQHTA